MFSILSFPLLNQCVPFHFIRSHCPSVHPISAYIQHHELLAGSWRLYWISRPESLSNRLRTGRLESPNCGERDNLDGKSPKSTNKPSTTTGIMKHGHAGAIPADLRCGNCHSTKTSSGWTWSKLDKDCRLCNRRYKCEKKKPGTKTTYFI